MIFKRILFSLLILVVSCGKDTDLAALITNPTAVTLLFPENATQCFEGTILSAEESKVPFRWNASDNTDQYELHVSNLLNGSTDIYETLDTEITVRIQRGVPYSWFVVSSSNNSSSTATSDIWSFYNAGEAIVSYIPFPAEPINPLPGAVFNNVNSVSLSWQASDLDNDISSYDIYLGSTSDPSLYQSDITNTTLSAVSVSSNTTYYWKVVTKDLVGNESQSEVFSFRVN